MYHASVELVWSVKDLDPLLVKDCELLDALEELLLVEARHIEVSRRLSESVKMLLAPEALQFASLLVLNNAHTLINTDTVVQRSGRSLHLDWPKWNDLW